ncbi:nucleotide pyrophosphohydrolase [Candidatus Micrarchaeota archaeon RBG_16_49_10]|nr:MAG: nucleotide pyrophosphohydrolase [Candidatus Micrarchaeota archaeon RBG_16_49_10]
MIFKDSSTSIQDFKDLVRIFCEERNWDQYHNAKELTIGIVTEASELLEHFRFKSEKEVNELFENETKRQEISEEIADVLYFLVRLAQKYDIDLATELNKKIKKNKKRYPIEKAKGSNKKYMEY